MTRKRILICSVLGVLLFGGCSESTSPGSGPGARIRIFNNVFQGATAATAVPISVDFLIDSSTNAPGVAGVANGSFAPGAASGVGAGSNTSGAAALFTAAGYRDLMSDTHTFQARKAGLTGAQTAFFRSATGVEFLPKQYLAAFPYTCVLAGVIPPDGTAWTASPIGFCIVSSPDDPFSPPVDTLPGHSGLTARVHFINAATFASTTGTGTSLTFTLVPSSASVSPANFTGTAAFRGTSANLNTPAGSYTLNVTSTAGLIYTSPVTFAAGEVRTILIYSTGFAANPVTAGNNKIFITLDNKF